MTVEDGIKEFEMWSYDLGFSFEVLPSKQILARLFSSGQSLNFLGLMQRVRPMHEVRKLRHSVAVQKIKDISRKMVLTKQIHSKEMQRYHMAKSLKKQLRENKHNIDTVRPIYQKQSINLEKNNTQKLLLNQDIKNTLANISICKLKSFEIVEQLKDETESSVKIDKTLPIELNANNSNASFILAALDAASNELHNYYSACNSFERYEVNSNAREELWNKLKKHLAYLSNFALWDSLNKQMNKESSTVEAMNETDMSSILNGNDNTGDNDTNDSSIQIEKLYAEHIKLVIAENSTRNDDDRLISDYVVFFNSFLSNLCGKFSMYNKSMIDPDFLGDYVTQYSAMHYSRCKVDFLGQIINENEALTNSSKKINEGLKVTNDILRNIYNQIEEKYCTICEDVNNLHYVKDKIQHSNNVLHYLLQRKNAQYSMQMSTTFRCNDSLNKSFSSNDEITITRSDSLNYTVLPRPDNTIYRSMISNLPVLLDEVDSFFKTPMKKFKFRFPANSDMGLSPNTVMSTVYNQLPNEMNALNHLTTSSISLHQLHSEMKWQSNMKKICSEIIFNYDLPIVDELNSLAKARLLKEKQAVGFNKASIICSNTHQILQMIQRNIRYFEGYSFSKFIPKIVSVNGQSYQDLEREFLTYYKIMQNAKGI